MNPQITSTNVELTDDIRATLDKNLIFKLDELLQDFAEDMKNPTIKLSRKSQPGPEGFIINFNMWLPGKAHIYAEEDSDTLLKAVVQLREAVERQLKAYRADIREKPDNSE